MPQAKKKPAGKGLGAEASSPARRSADFPKFTLEQALAVPNALQRNGGQPLDAITMATALERSPGSSGFRAVTASASAYGLTGGSYRTEFNLTEAGSSVVAALTPEERPRVLVAAALRPDLFLTIFDYYKGKKFPETQFFINTVVRQFAVDPKQAKACVDVFTRNMEFVGLMRETPGGKWLASAAGSTVLPSAAAAPGTGTEPDVEEAAEEPTPPLGDAEPPAPPAPVHKPRPNRIFVGHGKNKKPLEQLTKTLDTLGIPFGVAEDEPNAGRPISKKVRDTMETCGAAILIFSADIEYFDKDGEPVWKSSENVSHELGAASILYDDRIIIFKEEGVELASNFSGIGYITFEKNALEAKVNDLLKELVAFKILKLAVGDE